MAATLLGALCAVAPAVARPEEQVVAAPQPQPQPSPQAQPEPQPKPRTEPRSYQEDIVVEAPTRLRHGWTGAPPGSVEVLDAKRLQASGARTVQDALQALAGVHLVDQQGNGNQQDLTIRGLTATSVTGVPQGLSVFLDGVRVNEPAVEEVNFDLVPLAEVERIEIVHGPQAIFGRNTLGGALHIVTRRGGDRPDAQVEVEGGSALYRQVKARTSGPVGPLDGYLAAEQSYDGGWRENGASRVGRLFGKLGLRTGDTDATLSYQFQKDELHEPGSLPLSMLQADRTENYTPGDFFRPELQLVTLNATRRLAPGLSLTGNAFLRALDAEQFNASWLGPNTRLFNATRTVGATAQLDHRASAGVLRNQLAAGAEASRSSVRITVHEEPNAQNSSDPDHPDLILPGVSADVADTQLAGGAFVQDQLRVAEGPLAGVAVTAALRFDWIGHDIVDTSPGDSFGKGTQVRSYSSLVPAVGLRWTFAPRWIASASYSGGFRAPAFLELTCANIDSPCIGLQSGVAPDTGNAPLRAVRSQSFEAGLSAAPVDAVNVSFTVFRIDLQNDIFAVTLPSSTKIVFQNVGDTRRQGAELKLRAAAGPVAIEANYAFVLSTFESDVRLATPRLVRDASGDLRSEHVLRGAELPMSPHHRVALGARLRALSWLDLSAGVQVVSSQYYLGDEQNVAPKLPAYAVLGAGAEARWRRWSAFLRAANLLDTRYEVFGTFATNGRAGGTAPEPFLTPAPPLRIFAGVRWELE
ncbi:MAG TPA: TonB-dependent receptor [Anaeromyxobacter sp.]|nr:TonB-dependent receptor [Anaeromyxobacter sp.]